MSGVQKWSDGSEYCGTFEDDLKHGVGLYRWPNGEVHNFRDICLITSAKWSEMLCYFTGSLSVRLSVFTLVYGIESKQLNVSLEVFALL